MSGHTYFNLRCVGTCTHEFGEYGKPTPESVKDNMGHAPLNQGHAGT